MNIPRINLTSKASRKRIKEGVAPGTLLYTGEHEEKAIRISLIRFNDTEFHEKEVPNIAAIPWDNSDDLITWVNIDGVHDPKVVENIGKKFNIHRLILEDVLNTSQRPKVETYENQLFFVIKMIDFAPAKEEELDGEQVSIILGENLIISFQEREGDVFDPIRDRLRKGLGKVGKMQADYLAYLLLDAVVDQYFLILEELGEELDRVEQKLIRDPDKDTLRDIYDLKRDLSFLRQSVWPLREASTNLLRLENPLISREIGVYLRDYSDHVMRIIDAVEGYRDVASSLIDLYLSTTSIRMNEVMKVLTVISTIFIPLTFITGFYGMNLDHMPEIHSPWAYPTVIGIMAVMVILQLIWFRRKKWL